MNYYIYENWQAVDREGPVIHKWNCGHCHMGFGKRVDAQKGKNGVWIGPFDKIDFARVYFRLRFNSDPVEHTCVKKKCL
jgi:hypothetical protein